eukprot:5087380-Alexandrium_andersonii.AAC.1
MPLAKRRTHPWARSPRLPTALLVWLGCAPVQLGRFGLRARPPTPLYAEGEGVRLEVAVPTR